MSDLFKRFTELSNFRKVIVSLFILLGIVNIATGDILFGVLNLALAVSFFALYSWMYRDDLRIKQARDEEFQRLEAEYRHYVKNLRK